MYRITIGNRPVNAATNPTFWPMPNIKVELADTRGAKEFTEIDLCSGYWQAPLYLDSKPILTFRTP